MLFPTPPPLLEPSSRRRRAFTLIELIVVVIILAILAAIAGVAYDTYVARARDTALAADAKQTDLAITARSAQDDKTPSVEVAAAFASGTGVVDAATASSMAFASYFAIAYDAAHPLVFTPDSATAPQAVTVALGSRAECLTLGTEPGMAAALTSGACATPAPPPSPSGAADESPSPSASSPGSGQSTAGSTTGSATDATANVLAAGHAQTCQIASGQTIWCWGSNGYGGLGNGATTAEPAPTSILGGHTWDALATSSGSQHVCGIATGATAWCWGYNYLGQLGDGTKVSRSTPVEVSGNSSWSALTTGDNHTCGLKTDGTAWCWGWDTYGQLGDATTANEYTPVQVAGGGTWTSLAAGDSYTCGIKTDGTAWCWGLNNNGQLGDGTTTARSTPAQVVGGGTWVSLAPGDLHACGIKTDGTAWCWGTDSYGELGNGTSGSAQSSPVQVAADGTWTALSSGSFTTCGIKRDQTLWCWGNNANGQLGNATTTAQKTPAQVSGGGSWTALAAGVSYTCGIKVDGTTWCWGLNSWYQLGNKSTAQSTKPVATMPMSS